MAKIKEYDGQYFLEGRAIQEGDKLQVFAFEGFAPRWENCEFGVQDYSTETGEIVQETSVFIWNGAVVEPLDGGEWTEFRRAK